MSRKQVYNTEEPVSYLLEELPLEDDSSTDLESSDDVNVSLILYQMTMMLLKKAWRYCTFQPPFCYWWLIMKKRGWKLYRSPNTNPMGGRVRKSNSAKNPTLSPPLPISVQNNDTSDDNAKDLSGDVDSPGVSVALPELHTTAYDCEKS